MNIKKIWDNKYNIIEGYFNTYINWWNRKNIKQVSNKRLIICRSNICGFYDEHGTSKAAYIKGTESCGLCGCKLIEKTSCLHCNCALLDNKQEPLWISEDNK